MFQKIFGGIFGSSSHDAHSGVDHDAKEHTETNVSVRSGTSSQHGSSSTHGHKRHKHLRAQRTVKPYHNSQNPTREPAGFDRSSDAGSSLSQATAQGSARSPTATTPPPASAPRVMSRKPSAATLDAAAAASSTSTGQHARPPAAAAAALQRPLQTGVYCRDETPFLTAMTRDTADLAALRTLSWHGCPVRLRADVWMLLTGHWHPVKGLRDGVVARKRQEYTSHVQSNYNLVDWDAVCALADRGKDGAAVRRSTLLSQHPSHRSKGLPGRGPSHVSRTGTSSPGGTDGTGLLASAGGSHTGTPPLLGARPRPSHSALDLMALDGQQTRAPSPDADEGLHHQGQHAPHATSPDGGVEGDDRSDGSTPRTTGPEEDGDGDLLRDPSICSAPAALMEPTNSAPFDGPRSSARHADPTLTTATEPLSRPITPPFAASDSESAFTSPGPTRTTTTSTSSGAFLFPTAASRAKPSVARMSASAASSPSVASLPPRRLTPVPRVSVSTMVSSHEMQILKQIRKDVPRMSGGTAYLQHPRVQGMIERILFTWSLRHPACGYVQGMNDLLLPFVSVSLARQFCPTRSISELRAYSMERVSELWSDETVPAAVWIGELEADIYWCASYFLNGMQDNYTQNQTGIYLMCERLRQVIKAADTKLYTHLVDTLQLNFAQFTFRWMNCMLMRELTEMQQLRLMDAYLSDQERRWSVTHVYVCAALLLRWSKPLLQMDQFMDAAGFLQAPPTDAMSPRDMDDVLSEAFVLENLYDAGLQHLQTPDK